MYFQERAGAVDTYNKENLSLKMSMDNEFDLLYVVIYQKILQLSYVDKFLSDIQKKFRDLYENRLHKQEYYLVSSYKLGQDTLLVIFFFLANIAILFSTTIFAFSDFWLLWYVPFFAEVSWRRN